MFAIVANGLYFPLLATVKFIAVTIDECPCKNENDLEKCKLPECSPSMSPDELCEADQILPDGNDDYNVDNCPGNFDIFKCARGAVQIKSYLRLCRIDKNLTNTKNIL